MRYHAHERALDFELNGQRYVVPVGADVELPDHLHYVVKARGLALAEGPSPKGQVVRPVAASAPRGAADAALPERLVAEELADLSGEDPWVEGDAPEPDNPDEELDAAEKTVKTLDAQGIRIPGRRPNGQKKK